MQMNKKTNKAETHNVNQSTPEACSSMERPITPDRHQFQRELSQLGIKIKEKEQQRDELQGNAKKEIPGKIRTLKNELSESRKQKTELRTKFQPLETDINNLKIIIDAKTKEMSTIASTGAITFKSVNRVDIKIEQLEHDYKTTRYSNAREERSIVNEIDKLKRERHKMIKHNAIEKERRSSEDQLKQTESEKRMLRRDLKKLGWDSQNGHKQLHTMKAKLDLIKKTLTDLFNEKRELLQRYESHCQNYRKWSQGDGEKKQPLQQTKSGPTPTRRRPANFAPWSKKKAVDSDESDDEELELFSEEKQICDWLLNYLSRLLQHTDDAVLTELTLGPTGYYEGLEKTSSTESVDLPAGYTRLRRSSDESSQAAAGSSSSPRIKKKGSKKSTKKGSQRITHSVHNIQAFAQIGINAPATYADVPTAIAEIYDKLMSYDIDVTLPPPADELAMLLDDLSSESEMTSDSGAWGSMSSNSLSFTQGSASALASPSDNAFMSPVEHYLPRLTSSPTLTDRDRTNTVTNSVEYQRSLSDGTKSEVPQVKSAPELAGSADQISGVVVEMLLNSQIQMASDEGIDTEALSKNSSVNSTSVPIAIKTMRESSGIVPDLEENAS